MTSVFSWQNSISLCPASFCIPRPNLPVISGVSWLPTFFIPVPYSENNSFLGVLVLKGLVGLHRIIQLQLFQHHWWEHRLGLPCYWMVCLGNKQRSFRCFWDCIQVLHLESFVDYDGYSISSKEQGSFNFMAAVIICSDFGAQKNKFTQCFHCFPIYLPWSDGTRSHDLSFLNVEL